jgi:catalase
MSPFESCPPTTTDAGIPVASQEHSLTVGPDGPIVLPDFGQADSLINKVMDAAARDRLVETVSGLLAGLRRDEVHQRAFAYGRSTDKAIGDRIEAVAVEKRR